MFILKKKTLPQPAGLTACLSGDQIIQYASIKYYASEIKNLVSCAEDVYEKLYLMTLYRLAEFCQAMPFSREFFTNPYGLLERQLMLTVAALKLRQGKLLPKNAGTETIAAEEARWTYALFSVCLLRDIDSVQYDRKVTLQQANGEAVNIWAPLSGTLYERAFYYSMKFIKKEPAENPDLFMAAISGRIVPPIAVRWLAGNETLYRLWWASILHERRDDNALEEILEKAAEKTGIILLKNQPEDHKESEIDTEIDQLIAWLIKNTKENADHTFRIKEGFFISDHLINDFLSEVPNLSKDQFIQKLNKANKLILKGDGVYHSIAPTKFEDRRVLKGLVLSIDFLTKELQAIPINNQFKENIVL